MTIQIYTDAILIMSYAADILLNGVSQRFFKLPGKNFWLRAAGTGQQGSRWRQPEARPWPGG